MISTAEAHEVQLLAENALEGGLYNQAALDRMKANAAHFDRITLLRYAQCQLKVYTLALFPMIALALIHL